MKELVATLDRIAADESIRVVVLTGEGRAFSAGFDVSIDKDMPERTPAGWAEHFRLAYAGLNVFGRCRSRWSPKFVARVWAAGSP
jgi:enoyl-CoA hydratase/carnithine racemase